MDAEVKIASLGKSKMKSMFLNGSGIIINGPPFKFGSEYLQDYYVLLGEVPTHTIYRFLTKVKIGGILVAEVDNKDSTQVDSIVNFLNTVASQRAAYYFVDGIKYIFITRLES